MKRKTLFIKNAAVLTVVSLLLKTAGMVLRVWLSARLLGEGLGLYQLIVSVYLLVSKPLTAGFETAVTKIGSEGLRRSDRVVRSALLLALPAALIVGSGVMILADYVAAILLCDARAALSLRVLAFSIPFMAMSAVMKGYFISVRNTLPHSITQLIEQGVRMAAVFIFITLAAERGTELLCAAVFLADCVAEAISFLAIYIWGKINMAKSKASPMGLNHTSRALLGIALPVAGERTVTTAFHTAENLLIPALAAAMAGGRDAAVALFGVLKGMSLPLLFFPSSFLGVFSTLLIPEMAESAANGRRLQLQRAVSNTFHIIITFSVLLAALFFFFAERLGMVIYGNRDAAYMIRVLAPIVPFMYCESIADGMMKGLGQQVNAFWSGVVDAISRIGLSFLLVPRLGMNGFLIVMFCSNISACIYKASRVLRTANMKALIGKWIIKPITAALFSGAAASFLCGSIGISNNILFIAAAGSITSLLYFLLLYLSGTFNPLSFFTSLKSGS